MIKFYTTLLAVTWTVAMISRADLTSSNGDFQEKYTALASFIQQQGNVGEGSNPTTSPENSLKELEQSLQFNPQNSEEFSKNLEGVWKKTVESSKHAGVAAWDEIQKFSKTFLEYSKKVVKTTAEYSKKMAKTTAEYTKKVAKTTADKMPEWLEKTKNLLSKSWDWITSATRSLMQSVKKTTDSWRQSPKKSMDTIDQGKENHSHNPSSRTSPPQDMIDTLAHDGGLERRSFDA